MSLLKDRISRAIKDSGRTRADIAIHCGVSKSALSQWESGSTENPKNKHLFALAEITGVSAKWLATGKGPMYGEVRESTKAYGNVTPAQEIQQIPLVSWVAAGNWCGTDDPFPVGTADEYVPVTGQVNKNTFALKVRGDSMLTPDGKGFPDGAVIIVDPDIQPNNGSFVVVRLENSDEATFKQLVMDGGKSYLKPLNPRYPIIEAKEDAIICGVVKKMILEATFDN